MFRPGLDQGLIMSIQRNNKYRLQNDTWGWSGTGDLLGPSLTHQSLNVIDNNVVMSGTRVPLLITLDNWGATSVTDREIKWGWTID